MMKQSLEPCLVNYPFSEESEARGESSVERRTSDVDLGVDCTESQEFLGACDDAILGYLTRCRAIVCCDSTTLMVWVWRGKNDGSSMLHPRQHRQVGTEKLA